jgi:hypothetical protein
MMRSGHPGFALGSAAICLDLDCNTVFDFSAANNCPRCGGGFYLLAHWLNRDAAPLEGARQRAPRLVVTRAA